jgi:hypothetical protein
MGKERTCQNPALFAVNERCADGISKRITTLEPFRSAVLGARTPVGVVQHLSDI